MGGWGVNELATEVAYGLVMAEHPRFPLIFSDLMAAVGEVMLRYPPRRRGASIGTAGS